MVAESSRKVRYNGVVTILFKLGFDSNSAFMQVAFSFDPFTELSVSPVPMISNQVSTNFGICSTFRSSMT